MFGITNCNYYISHWQNDPGELPALGVTVLSNGDQWLLPSLVGVPDLDTAGVFPK